MSWRRQAISPPTPNSLTLSALSKDGEPPSVDFCPPTQKYKIEKYHDSVKAFWVEPKFSDNVRVVDVSKTNVSRKTFFLVH